MKTVSIFDVDHTLVRRSTGEYFLLSAARHGIVPWRLLLQVPFFVIKYRFGSYNSFEHTLLEKGIGPLEGVSAARLLEIAEYTFNGHVKKAIFPEMEALVRGHLNNGGRVVLATSSLDFIVAPLAEYLGVSEIIASRLEVKDGLCTGCFTETPVFGREKLARVEEYLKHHGFSLEQASFYSDSIHDTPLLEKVGKPVVVNPDYRLHSLAKKKKWSVVYC